MTWKPSPEPGRYDRQRVARLQPIKDVVSRLGLPPLRRRKITGILNALEMQIEDGGDAPDVNALLLDALRAVLRHRVAGAQLAVALQALDAWERAERTYWEQMRASTRPPVELTLDERLDDLMQEGYQLLAARQRTAACDRWLEAWDLVKQLARPEMRTARAFDQAHPLFQSVFNWCQDLEMELGNAGADDPVYHEHRLRYAREFLAQFPGSDTLFWLNFTRAQGEALWRLGHRAEAEAVYAALVERFPTEAWGYIGWADEYWLERDSPKAYGAAAAILQRALRQPDLRDRRDVLDRLAELYGAWGKPQEQAAVTAQLARTRDQTSAVPLAPPLPAAPPPSRKPGRNAPCWCGSGRKYKLCHLDADRHPT
jgi:tetratricopeptide (TPR) repeat protein